ncbi:hypothetical protein [Streptomyces scabiei]|uniref:hypothetical protein n=1 Tax=Streptomyces scabiei TaxID=1930 RepID=UPI000B1A0650|nr:hypothetical protein [Streptomyces scabiei]
MNDVWGIVGTVITVIGVVTTGFFTYRGTRAAASIQAGPQADATKFAILEATVKRVDEENGKLREKQNRLEALLRAFAWTTDRWARQMHNARIEPEQPHPLVDEYNRTGV